MRIEFNVSDVSSSEEDCRLLGVIVGRVAEQVGVAFESIEEVIVATPDRFGDVVARFDPSRKYTNSRGLLAVGKTIVHRKPNSPTSNTIFLQYSVVSWVFDSPKQFGRDFQAWPAEAQRNYYVLFHELGHCLDHANRPEPEDDGTYRTDDGLRAVCEGLKNFCTYNHSMLLSELAACFFSGIAYTDGVRALDCEMNNNFVREQLNGLQRRTNESLPNMGEIRWEAMGLFWFVLFQQAKLTGAKLKNPDLSPKPITELWEMAAALPEIAKVLTLAESEMETAWKAYPEFEPGFRDTLSAYFEKIAGLCGYRFQDQTGRDGVWWDRWLQQRLLGHLNELARVKTQ
jgi:hypothetical protein